MLGLAPIVLAAIVQTPAASCLHDRGTESAAQAARRSTAVMLSRLVNSAEAPFAYYNLGKYAELPALRAQGYLDADPAQVAPGFSLRLTLTEEGYWFEVVDTLDACGSRFISNEKGVIFEAQPIR